MSNNLRWPSQLADYLSWDVYDWLPKSHNVDIYPFGNQFRQGKPYSAWHLGSIGVFPHTKKYRIMRAILQNDLEEVQLVTEKGFDLNSIIDNKYGHTPLTLASSLNRVAIIQFLYFRGADINQFDNTNNTPLMWAVKNWQFESIKLLEYLGCNLAIKDQFGFDAIQKAQFRNLNAISKFLQNRQEERKNFTQQIPKFDIKMKIEELLKNPTPELIQNKKIYTDHSQLYPFNDLKGNYTVKLLNWLFINQKQ